MDSSVEICGEIDLDHRLSLGRKGKEGDLFSNVRKGPFVIGSMSVVGFDPGC